MPNVNSPFGLKPVRGAYGQPYNDSTQVYAAAAADATPIRYGDPVTATGAATALGQPIVTRSTAGTGNAITGVAVGFRPFGATEWLGYRPASSDYEILVEDNPFAEFEVQANGNIANDAAGSNAALAFTAVPANSNRSGAVLDTATVGTTVGLQIRLLGISRRVDNEPGEFAIWRCRLNNVTTTPNAASTGV